MRSASTLVTGFEPLVLRVLLAFGRIGIAIADELFATFLRVAVDRQHRQVDRVDNRHNGGNQKHGEYDHKAQRQRAAEIALEIRNWRKRRSNSGVDLPFKYPD